MAASKIEVFQGTTPKPTRDYLQMLLGDLLKSGRYDRLVVPCAGRFSIPQIARGAGWDPAQIVASDISLFSTIIGFLASHQDLGELGISFSLDLAELESYRNQTPAQFVGAILYGMKWAQFSTASQVYYVASQRRELEYNRDAYIEAFTDRARAFSASLGQLEYRIADIWDEIEACRNASRTICYVNPPAYKAGYSKMFAPIEAHIKWRNPAIHEFDPDAGIPRIFTEAQQSASLVLWYRYKTVTADEKPYVVFGHQYRMDRVDFSLANRPEECERDISLRPLTKVTPGTWAQFSPQHEIHPNSVVQAHCVSRAISLYYRELWAHKLGIVRSEDYFVLTVDGRVFAATGFHVSGALGRKDRKLGRTVFEDFGFNAPSRYKRLNTLLMLCLTCQQFRSVMMAAERCKMLAYSGEFTFATTCIADVPEIKANRGILKIISRDRLANGKFRILYHTPFHPGSFSEMVKKWLAKDGKVLEAA
jgi:hypothetical protein